MDHYERYKILCFVGSQGELYLTCYENGPILIFRPIYLFVLLQHKIKTNIVKSIYNIGYFRGPVQGKDKNLQNNLLHSCSHPSLWIDKQK